MSKFRCFYLATPPIKLKLEVHIHGGLLIANHQDQPIVIDQSEILSRSQVQFITIFLVGAQLCCAFYQPRQAGQIWCRENEFPKLNWHILTFLQ
jgi:hypothetical protein